MVNVAMEDSNSLIDDHPGEQVKMEDGITTENPEKKCNLCGRKWTKNSLLMLLSLTGKCGEGSYNL